MNNIIFIQKIGSIDETYLLKLKKNLNWFYKEYGFSIEIISEEIPLSDDEYASYRRQYDASLIMGKLLKKVDKAHQFPSLGILDKDIFSRTLNFVFGIALNPVRCEFKHPGVALISITRLKESFYRRAEDSALVDLRILKEAIHELGHAFSLDHCDNECVMRFSNSLSDTDEKPPKYCESCEKKLITFFNQFKP